MGTSGDKIVLLDGMGSGSGSATNGLLSMIPGMFANLIGGNNQYLFAMFYSDYFPKVLDCDQKIVKAVLAYLEDPDAPEGTAFVRYLAVRCFVGDTIKWSDMI